MNGNLTQSLETDSKEIQNMIGQVVSEAMKTLPWPKMPSWMEAMGAFIRIHPWIALLIAFLVILAISAIVREVICSYLKTNEILARLRRIEEKIK